MSKRDRVLSEEEAPVTTTTDPKYQELLDKIEAQNKRLEAVEKEKTAAEAKAAEAAERLKALAQQRARPSSTITTAMLDDPPPQVKESTRSKVRPHQVRLGRGTELGETNRTIVCPNLRGCGETNVHVTLPDHVRLSSGYDAYDAQFDGMVARVPQLVAEILAGGQPDRYSLVS